VTDVAGGKASTFVPFNLDQAPPSLNVTSPSSGSNFTTSQVSVQGLVTDALSGVQGVSCGNTAAVVSAGTFTCTVAINSGSNNISITATDAAGNTSTSTLTLLMSTPISVQITSPTSLQLFSSNPITVTGTVGTPNAVVTVGSIPATVSNGTFTASGVTLKEGKNLVTVGATSSNGGVGSDTVTAYLDTTPPGVTILSPSSGTVVTTPQIDVTGNVNDLVGGTVNADQVSVVVNGVTASVANRSFAAHNVLLVPGSNTIIAVATDRAGNTNQNQVQVSLQQFGGQQNLSIVSGNAQSSAINTVLPQPLVVLASDALGRPIPNLALNFAVTKSEGLIIAGPQQGRTLSVKTGANGQASVQVQLGSRNGVGINQVSVSAPGFVGQAVFSADSTAGAANQIHVVSGEVQTGAVGVALPEPLVTIVLDAGGNPVPNVPVVFTVLSGGGLINGQTTYTQNSDNDGEAYAVLVLGQQEGINNNVVSASFSGMTGQGAGFVSSGTVPGPASSTTVTGVVLDNAEQPIPNATASIQNTNLSALTNAQGQFTITNAPVGDIVLFIDGSTSTSSYTFPTLSFQMATVPGINNSLGHPIYLPPIDTSNSQVVGGSQVVQLTMTGVPGLVYTIAPNSVTFPDGTHVGTVTLSQVHSDRVPMIPANGTAPRLVGTLQPAGVLFNPPIQMQLPNTDGLPPGQVVEIYSFRHDLEQFVVEGTARVSADGSVIVSDPGSGLTVSGWHDIPKTSSPIPTCGDCCGACNKCLLIFCVADSSQNGSACTSNDPCIANGKCSSGSCNGDQKQITSLTVMATDPDNPNSVPQTPILKVATPTEDVYPIAFNAQASTQNCDDIQYDWDFGDGDQETNLGPTPTHNYGVAGTYTAQVTAHCGQCQTPDGKRVANILVGVATIEEVDVTVHATPNPNATTGGGSYSDDPPYVANVGQTQSLILPLGISPVDLECVTTPQNDDPVFGTQIQALTNWSTPQGAPLSVMPSGAMATVTFTGSGQSQVACFLDAAGTGQLAPNDAVMPVNTAIASISVDDVDTEVHSNQLQQDPTALAQGEINLISAGGDALNFGNLSNNVFNLRVDITIGDIDAGSVDTIGVVFAQELDSETLSASYTAPGRNVNYVLGLPVGNAFQDTLVCAAGGYTPISYPVLDAGTGVNGGATPSTTTGDMDPDSDLTGADRTITWADAPSQPIEATQPCDHNTSVMATSGGDSFTTYIVAYSNLAPHSYAVIGRADWSISWVGTFALNSIVWNRNNAATFAQSTGFITNSPPLSGAQAGLEVNQPVGVTMLKEVGN
jgi:hypothetical protein